MTANRWQIGVQYDPHRGGVNWSQPNGPNTLVYPQQQNQVYQSTVNPIPPGSFFSEFTGLWFAGCGHSSMAPLVFREWDYTTNQSVALICCELCSYCQSTVEPYSEIYDPVAFPILIL